MSDILGSTSAPADSGSVGKCPVDFETRSLWSLLGRGKPGDGGERDNTKATAGTDASSTVASVPASLEEAARHAQTPHTGQRLPLSTHRLESTIPRSNPESIPAHQIRASSTNHGGNDKHNNNNNNTWVYPSEQQVFNAMKRKGWKGIEEESIPSFLQIHNSVNERSWREVQQWEELSGHSPESVELSRFEGRPTDLTPKAWFLSTLGLSDKPFDRHDWYVVHKQRNGNGGSDGDSKTIPEKRYVLDFYMTDDVADDPRTGGGMPRVDIDIRPALDSPEAFLQRGQGLLREAFPGIAREFDERHEKNGWLSFGWSRRK